MEEYKILKFKQGGSLKARKAFTRRTRETKTDQRRKYESEIQR